MHIKNKIGVAFLLLLIICYVEAIINQNFLPKNKKKAVTNVTGQNVLGINKKQRNLLNGPSFVQQYMDNPKLNDFNDKSYGKYDFYLWDEGVTALAYDDFFEGKTKFITNIEYLGAGYNIAQANPNPSSGIDPGYTTHNAFKFELDSTPRNALSADGDYFVPEGVNLLSKTTCQITFSSQDISSMDDYQSSLSISMGASVELPLFSFKRSFDYKQAEKTLNEQDTSIISTKADCLVHKLDINKYNQPKWSDSLNSALDYLLNNDSVENIWEFFEFYGTHVTVGVDLGAKFGYEFIMKKSKVDSMKSNGFSTSLGASFFGNGGTISNSYSKESQKSFNEAMTSWKQTTVGAPPDTDNDPAAWAQNINDSPMPIKGKFVSWSDFVIEYSDNESNKFSKSQLEKLQKMFNNAMDKYCTGYLLANKYVQNCNNEKSQGAFQDGKYNVPGGVLYPGINYNQLGGNIGYFWEKIGRKCYDVATDVDGTVWCMEKDTYKTLKYTISEKKWEQVGGITGTKIDVSNGKVVVVDKASCTWYTDVWAGVGFSKFGDFDCGVTDVCVDEQGIMWTLDDDGKTSMFIDPSKAKGYTENEKTYISCAGGRQIYFSKENKFWGEFLYDYDKNNWGESNQKRLLMGQKIQDGCLTQGKWAYKLMEDSDDARNNRIYFTQDVTNYNEYGNKDVDGKAKRIACTSTATGPIIAIVGKDDEAYLRKVNP